MAPALLMSPSAGPEEIQLLQKLEEANRSVLVLGKVLWVRGQQVSAGSGEDSVGGKRPTGQCWLYGRFCGWEANRSVLALRKVLWVGGQQVSSSSGEGSVSRRRPTGQC